MIEIIFCIKLKFSNPWLSRPGFTDCNMKRLAQKEFACINTPPQAVSLNWNFFYFKKFIAEGP